MTNASDIVQLPIAIGAGGCVCKVNETANLNRSDFLAVDTNEIARTKSIRGLFFVIQAIPVFNVQHYNQVDGYT